MTHLSLRRWSYQFTPAVIAKIRRKISGRIAAGECLVVHDDDTQGLTQEAKAEIMKGWSSDKVTFTHAHWSAGRRFAPPRRTQAFDDGDEV